MIAPVSVTNQGRPAPLELTTPEIAAFQNLGGLDATTVIIDPDACHDSLVYRSISAGRYSTEASLRGLVSESIVGVGDTDDPSKYARLKRFPNATYMNELAPFFGLIPGETTFRFVNTSAGGLIPPLAYAKHIAAKEAPPATYNPEYVRHDREIDDHLIGWWTLPSKFIDKLAAKAQERVDAFEADPSPENDEKLANFAGAVDAASSLEPTISSPAIAELFEGEKGLGKLILSGPRSLPYYVVGLNDAVREVYFDGKRGPAITALVGIKALQLHRQRYRKALELAALAEQARPEIDQSPITHMGRRAVYWAKTHMPI